jgi:MFS family permease
VEPDRNARFLSDVHARGETGLLDPPLRSINLGILDGRAPMGPTERRYYVLEGSYMAWGWFMGPIYPLFLLSRGLDVLQASSVLATYFVVTFLFEVPTGAVADVFGRRVSFLLACATRMCAFLIYFRADGYLDCLLAEVVDAIGTTLASGALQAWAVDGIRKDGDSRPMDRIFARAQIVQRTMMIAGGVIGGAIADANIALPWLIAGAGFGLTGIYAFFVMEEAAPAARPSWSTARQSITDTIGAAVTAARTTPIVRVLCVLTAAVAVAVMPAHFLWPARLEELLGGASFWLLGWVWALINLTAAVGSVCSERFFSASRREHVLFATAAVRALGILVAALAPTFGTALIGLLILEFAFAISHPAYQAWLNEHVESHLRATVLSVANMSFTVGGGAGLLTLGWLARETSISVTWTICAILLFAIAPAFLLLGRVRGLAPVAAPLEPAAPSLGRDTGG